MKYKIINKYKVKDEIFKKINPYGNPTGGMIPTIVQHNFYKDCGYILIGWNTFIKLIDECLNIKYK